MTSLIDEINACGIVCNGIYEGFTVTDPPYGELSSSDQAIVDACIAAHDMPFSHATITALQALLTVDQQKEYRDTRNEFGHQLREAKYKKYIFPMMWDWIDDEVTKADLQAKKATIDGIILLWSEGGL